MGLKFTDFCRKTVTSTQLTEVTASTDIPIKYVKPLDVLIKDMKKKVDIFDKINIPYVEAAFDGNDIVKKLDRELVDGEIPDGIINKLSEGIFERKPAELTDVQGTIIKVLAVYICIQN